jgi:hypothetical protein
LALSSFSRIAGLKEAIDNRNSASAAELIRVASKVLQNFGRDLDDSLFWPKDRAEQRELMKRRGGIVADTVKLVQPFALQKLKMIHKAVEVDGDADLFYPD